MKKNKLGIAITAATLSALMLTGCGDSSSGSDDEGSEPEVSRVHDTRTFTPASDISFEASGSASAYYGIYEGVQGPAVYAAEMPDNWNGGLIMYTHGYRGEGAELAVSVPDAAWRATVLGAGYAWAASSYSANYYDVRAGIEDTNKLALEVMDYIEADFGEAYDSPQQVLISGYSLGGHTAAAAVDRENMERTAYKVDYQGALPFCQAEQNQFQWLGDYTRVVQELSGFGDTPDGEYQQTLPSMLVALFETDGNGNITWEPANQNGERAKQIAMDLTGGERPVFYDYGFPNPGLQGAVLGTGGRGGDINGILAKSYFDNMNREYRWTDEDTMTAEEASFNEAIRRDAADEGVNPLRDDGVRWLPLVEGDFDVPVLTLHTLGDFYVPFRHQQLYREGAIENGSEDLLVQRAIRAPSHCDFTGSEISTALIDWLTWVNGGPKPGGDEVLDPAVVADPQYGCDYTINDASRDRSALPSCDI
ncbi:alpha/beta hydrolase [Marinobacter bryozoorum]|uniref:alpha/beta hydrolase n=1 Tax=Marinobacter bryozoorum TaxID=256324 RepID=UPI002003C179|nr:alpha/beta hydrolase [Marinobacter bryozoorum]MCK7543335.1 alpha/beta hydrolase [Marinobacter bryozoorum]